MGMDVLGDNVRKASLVGALLMVSICTANAEVYSYSCQACIFPTIGYDCEAVGKPYPLRVDANKSVLEWRGKKYGLTIASADDEPGCARAGWHAKGNGASFTFCAATQGYGAIEDKDGVKVQCNLKR